MLENLHIASIVVTMIRNAPVLMFAAPRHLRQESPPVAEPVTAG